MEELIKACRRLNKALKHLAVCMANIKLPYKSIERKEKSKTIRFEQHKRWVRGRMEFVPPWKM